jgi:hypothetical protein
MTSSDHRVFDPHPDRKITHEVDEHQLRDRAQPPGGCPDGRPDKGRLGDRGVQDPAGELVVQALGDAEYAAPGVLLAGAAGPAGVVLAHDHDRGVAGHLLGSASLIASR